MMSFGYYLQPGQYTASNNGNLYRILPFSLSYTSIESSVSAPTINDVLTSQTATKMQSSKFNPLIIKIPSVSCSCRLSELKNKNLVPTTETFISQRSLQKKSTAKTFLRQLKQRNKLAVLKYMIQKRKQQQFEVTKRKLPEIKIEEIVPQTIETNSVHIIAQNLKITFNQAQQIESISLHYHQRHKHEIKTPQVNNLDLLIEAVKLIEMHNGSLKLALESIK